MIERGGGSKYGQQGISYNKASELKINLNNSFNQESVTGTLK